MAAVLVGMLWLQHTHLDQPITTTLYTDSFIFMIHYVKGLAPSYDRTLWYKTYISMLLNKVETGHGLVV
jgi:hypothetical protein